MPVFTSPFYDEVPPDLGGNEVWARQQGRDPGDGACASEPARKAAPLAIPVRSTLTRAWTILWRALGAGRGRSGRQRAPKRFSNQRSSSAFS